MIDPHNNGTKNIFPTIEELEEYQNTRSNHQHTIEMID